MPKGGDHSEDGKHIIFVKVLVQGHLANIFKMEKSGKGQGLSCPKGFLGQPTEEEGVVCITVSNRIAQERHACLSRLN